MKNQNGLFSRFKKGLSRTRNSFIGKVNSVVGSGKKLTDDLLEELEEIFITSDMGVNTTGKLLEELKKEAKRERLKDRDQIISHLKDKLTGMLSVDDSKADISNSSPYIILIVGVNGSGKTTTIGKLAGKFTSEGKRVMLAAGDTFRAAAIEQLEVWSKRAGVDIVKHKSGADPSAVVFDAITAAKARNTDILIVDTAGRLHTKINLMEGLKKIKRVISKALLDAPHEVLLVLDAGLGQNTVAQAKEFNEAIEVSGLVLTKLDGTARGGVIINIVDSMKIPVKYIGVGEGADDLAEFNPALFVEALFEG